MAEAALELDLTVAEDASEAASKASRLVRNKSKVKTRTVMFSVEVSC